MSFLTIILMNIGLAVILSAILALVMLSPRRLRPTLPGAQPHRKASLAASREDIMEPHRRPGSDSRRRPLQPLADR